MNHCVECQQLTLTVKIEQLPQPEVRQFQADAAVPRGLDAEDVVWLEVAVEDGGGEAVEVGQGGGQVRQLPPHLPYKLSYKLSQLPPHLPLLKHLTVGQQGVAAQQALERSSETDV